MLGCWAPSLQEPEPLQRVGARPLPPTLSSLSPPGLPSQPWPEVPTSALHTGSAPHGSTDKPSPITVRKLGMWLNTGLFYRDCFLGSSLNSDIPLLVQKIKVGGEGMPFSRAGVLGCAVGSGVRSWVWLLLIRVQAGSLDVQRGLLTCEQSEHGGRHGLHVDLPMRERSGANPALPASTSPSPPLTPKTSTTRPVVPKHPEHVLCKLPASKERKNDLPEVTTPMVTQKAFTAPADGDLSSHPGL